MAHPGPSTQKEHMSTQQPESLRLADELEAAPAFANSRGTINLEMSSSMAEEAATELRRLHAVNAELLGALKKCQFALEPYDDIKPRDWKTDRERLAAAHQVAIEALSKAEGREA